MLRNKQILLSLLFFISLLPMLLNQYGGAKNVQEITGLINIFNPIGIISIILYFIGVWIEFKNKSMNKTISIIGLIGIIISEMYTFFTWHYQTITGKINFQLSTQFAFPEFYFGIMVSVIMLISYFIINKKCGRKG